MNLLGVWEERYTFNMDIEGESCMSWEVAGFVLSLFTRALLLHVRPRSGFRNCFGYGQWSETFVVEKTHSFAVGGNLGPILALNQPWDTTVHPSPVPLLSPYHRLTRGHHTTSYCFMWPAVKLPDWITEHLYINNRTWFRSPWSCCFRYETAMKHIHHVKSCS